MAKTIGVGVIGMGWMGELHSRSYTQVPIRFHEAVGQPKLVVCADEFEHRAEHSQRLYGFEKRTTDWRAVVDDPSVDVINLTTPNHLHVEIAEAVAQAGKHLLCEKPVGRSPQETARIARSVEEAGIISHVGFNYRWIPVLQYTKQLIDDGRIGAITHYRGGFLEGYAANPHAMLTWRFLKDIAGMGVLGDMMSHSLDMAHMLIGPISEVVAQKETFIPDRPQSVAGEGTHFDIREDGPRAQVENEDYVSALLRFENGARGTMEACRVVVGEKIALMFQINGRSGAFHWHLERQNELEFYEMDDKDASNDGYRHLLSGPQMPFHSNFNPAEGLQISYDDTKIIEAHQFLEAVAEGRPSEPGLPEALRVAEVAAAMQRSWESGSWEKVTPISQ